MPQLDVFPANVHTCDENLNDVCAGARIKAWACRRSIKNHCDACPDLIVHSQGSRLPVLDGTLKLIMPLQSDTQVSYLVAHFENLILEALGDGMLVPIPPEPIDEWEAESGFDTEPEGHASNAEHDGELEEEVEAGVTVEKPNMEASKVLVPAPIRSDWDTRCHGRVTSRGGEDTKDSSTSCLTCRLSKQTFLRSIQGFEGVHPLCLDCSVNNARRSVSRGSHELADTLLASAGTFGSTGASLADTIRSWTESGQKLARDWLDELEENKDTAMGQTLSILNDLVRSSSRRGHL